MSNLRTAKLAIEAEIAHAKKGAAYYAERVNSLEQALARIASAEEVSIAPSAMGKEAKANRKTKAAGRRGTKNPDTAQVAELPSTGGDYWKNLVTDQPKSGQAILADAVNQLGFAPTKTQVGKLRNRMTFALQALVKSGEIQDSGIGRERRFFKK